MNELSQFIAANDMMFIGIIISCIFILLKKVAVGLFWIGVAGLLGIVTLTSFNII